jgi:hypothetical protein
MSVRFSLTRDGIIMSVRFSLSRDGIIMSVRFNLLRDGIIMFVRFSYIGYLNSIRHLNSFTIFLLSLFYCRQNLCQVNRQFFRRTG